MKRNGGWEVRVYRFLLRWYPREFREKYGSELTEGFIYLLEARGRNTVGIWLGTLWDVAWGGASERWGRGGRLPKRELGRRGGRSMESWRQDLHYGARTLLRNPGFTVIAVMTIALGIGANTAIFSVVDAVLLEPLPYDDPDELVVLWAELLTRDVEHFPYSAPEIRDLRDQTQSLESIGGVVSFRQPLTGDGDPVQISVAGVTTNLLDVLGVTPQIGRVFTTEDGGVVDQGAAPATGAPPNSVILSDGLWQRRFGGDPDVVGRTLEVGGATSVIVGVMPAGFELWLPPQANVDAVPDLYTALRLDYDNSPRNNVFLAAVGRLREGASMAQAQGELDAVTARFSEHFPIYNTIGYRQRAVPLIDDVTRDVRPVIMALVGAVAFVLLIACANVANLLMVRASSRERELAVRAAMGGDRFRLARQMVTESLLLSGLGASVGLGLAWVGIEALRVLGPADLPRLGGVSLDSTVLLFTAVAATLAALAFGVIPAIQASRPDLTRALGERGRGGSGIASKRLRSSAVVLQVALSLVLLVGTGLMVRSYHALARTDPGFDPEGVVTFTTNIPAARYPEPVTRSDLATQLADIFRAIPGVEAVGGVFPLPLSGQPFNGRYGTESALEDERNFRQAAYRSTVPGYFDAMGTELLSGRVFDRTDYVDSLSNVVIDAPLAARTWPGESAVGKRLLVRPLGPEPVWVDVIGVVEHQRHQGLATEGMETIYFTDRYLGSFGSVTWTIKAGEAPEAVVPQMRSAVARLDPLIPLDDVRTMDARVQEAAGGTRFGLVLIGAFGVLALSLASVGLYGVLSYAVRQRTGEIGVRMAFGAERGMILKLVLRQGLVLSLGGVALGIPVALMVTGVMESMLVGVRSSDPATYMITVAFFAAVAAVASLIPALRAVRIDPVVALRED